MKFTVEKWTGGLLLAAGLLIANPRAAFACHEPTGWCCVPDTGVHDPADSFCCWFSGNKLIGCMGET